MKIALDYDKTFTEDKALWTAFVHVARALGHAVTFVTFRASDREGGNDDILDDARALGIEVVFTGGIPKAECFPADIWIDDWPALIPSADDLATREEIRARVQANKAEVHPTIQTMIADMNGEIEG